MNIGTVSIGVAAFLENMFIASNGMKTGWKLIKLNFRLFLITKNAWDAGDV